MVEKSRTVKPLTQGSLGIFAKQPLPGQVKTRLIPPLTAAQAAELYAVALSETVERFCTAGCRTVLFYAGDRAYFEERFAGLELRPQIRGGLGARMSAALAELLAAGNRPAALIGSDSPDLPVARVAEAFELLEETAMVTAPARDGGYVLVGVSQPLPEMFAGIPWSTPEVLAATRERAEQLQITYRELTPWEDVDDLPSLRRLLQRSPQAATSRFAARQLASLLNF